MFLNVNKPKGPTSFDVVAAVRKISGIKKVGHAGTLDPLASGVLVVAVGREFTRQISKVVEQEKEYIATIKLGISSTTDDEEGKKTKVSDKKPSMEEIKIVLKKFVGMVDQVPPIYSAVKIKGKPAYKHARKGKDLKLEPRKVEIKDIELVYYDYPTLKLRVTTGKGVYIRSLARDIGEELASGAYMTELIRTKVGQYKLEESLAFDSLEKYFKSLKKSQVV